MYQGGSLSLPRDLRRAGRAISKYKATGEVSIAAVDTTADVTMAKIDSVTACTGQAMGAVTRVAQAQTQLELLTPTASPHLAFLALEHAHGMSEILADHRREIRRL